MVTALVLQLVQCIIKLPSAADNTGTGEDEDTAAQDVIITTSYEQAMKTAHHFLSVFLKKYVYMLADGDRETRKLCQKYVFDIQFWHENRNFVCLH